MRPDKIRLRSVVSRTGLTRVAQAGAVLLAAIASVATSDPAPTTFANADGGAPPSSGVVVLTQGSPSSTVDLTLKDLDSSSPVLTISPASPIDATLTPNNAPFPAEFLTVTLLTPNGNSPAGKELVLTADPTAGGSGTTYTMPAPDAIGRGCVCPASPAPMCDQGTDASATDDGGSEPVDGGTCTAADAGCDTCNARVRLTFLLPSGFTSLNVGYNLFVAHGTVTSP